MTKNSISPLPLPNVTLVIIETGIGELTNLSLKDTLKQISPKEVIVLTDIGSLFPLVYNGRTKFIPPLGSIEDYNKHLWYTVPPLISTSHMLVIQWDGWVINPEIWDNSFLSYDYIGAVWPWHRGHRVGNGGFSLRSTKLMQYVAESKISPGRYEDDTLCRQWQWNFANSGNFRWAPETLADQFSREHNWHGGSSLCSTECSFNVCCRSGDCWRERTKPFGFHDCRNWPRVLTPEQLSCRLSLCEIYPYIRNKPEYQQLRRMLK